MSFHVPNDFRVRRNSILATDNSYGNNGMFMIPHYKIADYFFAVQASDGEGWQHVSVSLVKERHGSVKRCPTWEEMCWIKDKFWDEQDCVIQFHPAKSEYISMHNYVLHQWRPTSQAIPIPDKLMVGIDTPAEEITDEQLRMLSKKYFKSDGSNH